MAERNSLLSEDEYRELIMALRLRPDRARILLDHLRQQPGHLDYRHALVECRRQGMPLARLADHFGVSTSRVKQLCERAVVQTSRVDGRARLAAARPSLEAPMDLPVEELGLGVRATNCLENAGIQTVGQLVSLTEWELLRIRNFGRKTLGEIKHALQEVGLSLGMHDVQTGAVGGVRAQARPPAYVGTLAARPVSDLEIGVRTTKWLESNDIRTIGQLASFREWELLQIRNFGRKMLGEIKCALQEVGLSLGLRELGAPGEVDARAAAGASSGSLGTISEWLVADLGLGVRATNCLENAGVLTVGQLVSCTEWEVIEMDSVGRKTLQEIKNALREFGLSLGMRTAAP